MKEINFVVSAPKQKTDLQTIILRLYPFILWSVALLVVFTGIVLALFFYAENILKKNDQKIAIISTDIKKQAKNESYLLMISEKIKTIEKIYGTNQFKSAVISEIKLLFVPGFTLLNFEITPLSEYKVYGICADSQCLTNLNEKLEVLNQEKKFSSIALPTTQKEKGIYKVYIELKK